MSTENIEKNTTDVNEDATEAPPIDELTALKARADQMGITYHPAIGVAKLKEKVNTALAGEADKNSEPAAAKKSSVVVRPKETIAARNSRIRAEATKLVRIRISCMNPAKRAWPGEIMMVCNSVIGTVKKFIPFNAEEGWHVPNVIYEHLKERQCQVFYEVKMPNGQKQKKGKLIKEFSVELLPALTKKELADLAQRQAMSNSID